MFRVPTCCVPRLCMLRPREMLERHLRFEIQRKNSINARFGGCNAWGVLQGIAVEKKRDFGGSVNVVDLIDLFDGDI